MAKPQVDAHVQPRVHIGVDVSKGVLDVYIPGEKGRQVKNTPCAIRALVRSVKSKETSAMFCCESTGGYERALLDVCREEGQPVCLMNAQQVRCFAGHRGTLEKTDRIDARIISQAADDKKPSPLVHADARQRKLKELWTLRVQLVDERESVRNRLDHLREKEGVAAVDTIIAAYDGQIAALEKLCRETAAKDKATEALLGRFQLVKGVGLTTALALAALLPELLFLDNKRLTKLAGLAPIPDQSGTKDGPRHIQKGRRLVRNALYFAAVSASQHNEILSAFYGRLVKQGKEKKVALVAVMRKLLCLMRRIAQTPDFVPATK
jgi:transposase